MTMRWLLRLVALLAVAVAVSTVLSWVALSKVSGQANRIEAQAQRIEAQARRNAVAAHALCVLREDLSRRVTQSKDYLRENPRGAPGISVKVIRDGIANQQRTIDALSGLKC